jgi:hypothetical protein
MTTAEIFKLYPKALEELQYQIARNDLEYADNLRVAVVGDHAQMDYYEDKRARGCCGTFDIRVTIDGKKFDIGCNYGH